MCHSVTAWAIPPLRLKQLNGIEPSWIHLCFSYNDMSQCPLLPPSLRPPPLHPAPTHPSSPPADGCDVAGCTAAKREALRDVGGLCFPGDRGCPAAADGQAEESAAAGTESQGELIYRLDSDRHRAVEPWYYTYGRFPQELNKLHTRNVLVKFLWPKWWRWNVT